MKTAGSCSFAGWFVGVDVRKWKLKVEPVDEPMRHPYRRYRARALWLGPLCVITRGRFVWTPPTN